MFHQMRWQEWAVLVLNDFILFLQFRGCSQNHYIICSSQCLCVFFQTFNKFDYLIAEDNILHKILSTLFQFSLPYWHPINHFGNVWLKCFTTSTIAVILVSSKVIMRILSWMSYWMNVMFDFVAGNFLSVFLFLSYVKSTLALSPIRYLRYKIHAQNFFVFREGDEIISWLLIISSS